MAKHSERFRTENQTRHGCLRTVLCPETTSGPPRGHRYHKIKQAASATLCSLHPLRQTGTGTIRHNRKEKGSKVMAAADPDKWLSFLLDDLDIKPKHQLNSCTPILYLIQPQICFVKKTERSVESKRSGLGASDGSYVEDLDPLTALASKIGELDINDQPKRTRNDLLHHHGKPPHRDNHDDFLEDLPPESKGPHSFLTSTPQTTSQHPTTHLQLTTQTPNTTHLRPGTPPPISRVSQHPPSPFPQMLTPPPRKPSTTSSATGATPLHSPVPPVSANHATPSHSSTPLTAGRVRDAPRCCITAWKGRVTSSLRGRMRSGCV